MKVMLPGLIQILLFQSIGEIISKFFLPFLPGPVIGLVLLLCWLVIQKKVNTDLALVSDTLSQYLGLLFVPAAVGVVLFLPQLKTNALPIFAALIGSVIFTIMASALVLKFFQKWSNK
ncbi:MAG: CidA/LrgA family protein [Betaproteobacteria bacterium]